MNKKKRVTIFDFDGVFVDDFDFHKQHIEEFLGVTFSDEVFYKIHSGNVYRDDGAGLELGTFDTEKYCSKIHDELVKMPMVEGMKQIVEEAQRSGEVFIVSSGCEENISDFFKGQNVCDELCEIYGVETNPSKEQKLKKILVETGVNPNDVIFITDTLGDIEEANNVGIASIAVTWGFQRLETLEKGFPFGFANNTRELSELIKVFFDIAQEREVSCGCKN